jgi:endonuclease VIII
MPEGHTIHRLARRHCRELKGPLAVSSPQGRAAGVAAALDGARIERFDAHGKHLLYRWSTGDILHIHLGLYGRFRRRPSPPPEPRGQIRLRIVGETATADLSGAIACELLDPAAEEVLLARLGPDPLREDGDPERFAALLRRRRIPIGAALLDQRVIAGIGNVYRAELLNGLGIDPRRPARDLEPELVRALWDESARLLAAGVRAGRIVTRPKPPGSRRVRRDDALWVYRRARCARCDGPVEVFELAARTMYSCPGCQPAVGGGA